MCPCWRVAQLPAWDGVLVYYCQIELKWCRNAAVLGLFRGRAREVVASLGLDTCRSGVCVEEHGGGGMKSLWRDVIHDPEGGGLGARGQAGISCIGRCRTQSSPPLAFDRLASSERLLAGFNSGTTRNNYCTTFRHQPISKHAVPQSLQIRRRRPPGSPSQRVTPLIPSQPQPQRRQPPQGAARAQEGGELRDALDDRDGRKLGGPQPHVAVEAEA